MKTLLPLVMLCALGVGCAHSKSQTPSPPAATPAPISAEAIVAAPDRSEADKALDAGRHPAAFLEFLALAPGMKVGELFAGGGYTTELLARSVGPGGVVYGQNSKWVLEKFAEAPWTARLAKLVNANVVRVDRELDAPLPPEAKELDLVVSHLIYHDTVWLPVDRTRMNAAIFSALKPGGRYVVCDSSAAAGHGVKDVQTLHRIEESVVRQEVMAAGFTAPVEGDFLRNAADTRDWNSSPGAAGAKRGTSDRFCYCFEKAADAKL